MTETQVAPKSETNGKGPEMLEVTNPATGEVVGSVARQTPADVAEAVKRARAAQPAWQALGYEGRGHDRVRDRQDL